MPGQGGGGGAGGGQGVWGGGRAGGGARGARGGGDVNVKGREEIRKFLNFYKRRNSVCVDLYQPAFYTKKPNWEDLAEFVYSVLAVGGASSPQLIRAAVVDIQLHPVKKLLFLKFSDQTIRDEIAARLQTGLVWPAFSTTVTGWAMDKPVERIRVLGVSPETDEVGVRAVLQVYGEILDARKGFISKKLPGCTNGIWTVKLVLEQEKLLPPFLIMKEEGEVWQLATGEVSVCWKCGQTGHIGDRCHQDVSALAASLSSPVESHQPSWAHVVRGAIPLHPRPPPLPAVGPRVGVLGVAVTVEALILSRSNLALCLSPVLPLLRDENGDVIKLGKVLSENIKNVVNEAVNTVMEETIDMLFEKDVWVLFDRSFENFFNKAVDKLEDVIVDKVVNEVVEQGLDDIRAPARSSMDVQMSLERNGEEILEAVAANSVCPVKKVKLSSDVNVPRDPRLRARVQLSTSPDLPHKVPAGGELRHGPVEEVLRHDPVEGLLLHGQIEGHGAGLESVGKGKNCGDAEEGLEKPMVSSEVGHKNTS